MILLCEALQHGTVSRTGEDKQPKLGFRITLTPLAKMSTRAILQCICIPEPH